MCDAFLVLAQAPGGLSCFFMPRFTPYGARNALHIQRLKDKLGNRSNASSEVEFEGAFALLLGEEGRGVPTILEMGTYTRLDCALGTAGMMRACVAGALHHARHREAFGRQLARQPLMQNVLADLALEAEAAIALAMRLARAFDGQDDPGETALRRLLTPVAKYWICKRGPTLAAEAMEVLGGNGYVEDWPLARLYREMPVNSIWEGSGNVMCLDVLRAAQKSPAALALVEQELAAARGADTRLDRAAAAIVASFSRAPDDEAGARRLTEQLALALQAALLVRFAPPAVGSAFCAARLGEERGASFGTLPAGTDVEAILARA
jgi:putative acyl-CoA dehydrogenase